MKQLFLFLLLTSTLYSATYTTTSTPGTWDIGGSPGSSDNIIVAHDWSSYNQGTIANYTGTLTINNGCYFKINGSITTWTNPVINIGTSATFLVTGDVSIQSSSITVTCNGTWHTNGNFFNLCGSAWSGTGNLLVDGVYTANGCDLGSVTLPVELAYFKVVNDRLEWMTFSEINNDKFEILYSRDGSNFNVDTIIQGNGTTTHINYYSSIAKYGGYYKLKQIDFDGTPTEFNVVYFPSKDNNSKLIGQYDIFGNPVDSNYEGVIINKYSDGKVTKKLNNLY
jgi:hypothetical protein